MQTGYNGIGSKYDTPKEVKGIWWGLLEKGQCLQDNIDYYGDYNNTRYSYTQIGDTDTDTMTELNTEMLMWIKVALFFHHYKLPISAFLFIFGTTSNVILIIIIITCNKDTRTLYPQLGYKRYHLFNGTFLHGFARFRQVARR